MTIPSGLPITIKDIKDAQKIVSKESRRTPIIKSFSLSAQSGGEIFLKLENLQLTGSFKFRGAFNKVSSLTEEEKKIGVIGCSAGNHSQGMALATKLLGVKATVVMPETAPASKVAATKGYGATVIQHGETFDDAKAKALELQKEQGLVWMDPFEDVKVMAGQGTIGIEIIEDMYDVDTVIAPIGGGGLFSGLAVALKSFNPDIKLVGVQSENIHGMKASREAGKPTLHGTQLSWADGAAVKMPGDMTFQVTNALADDIVTVSEEEIKYAMKQLVARGKQIVEGSGAMPSAAIRSGKINPEWIKGKKVVGVVSGGNVDLKRIVDMIEATQDHE